MLNKKKVNYGSRFLNVRCPPGYEYNPAIIKPDNVYKKIPINVDIPSIQIIPVNLDGVTVSGCSGGQCPGSIYQPNWDPSKSI